MSTDIRPRRLRVATTRTLGHSQTFSGRLFRQLDIQSMVLPGFLLLILFHYFPFYGILIAFKNYDIGIHSGAAGILTAPWAGLRYFREFVTSPDFGMVLRNTLGINLLALVIRFPSPIVFALLLNEIANVRFKRSVQTISYLPHFISWAVYGGIIVRVLAMDTGVVNGMLLDLGFIDRPIAFMAEPRYFWSVAVMSRVFKELGWGAILYLASIAGIDPQLYEAATIDGAGRYRKMWHITLPSISGTIIILLILSISYMLNTTFDQLWVLQNNLNLIASETIDTYVYRVGLGNMRFSYSTAVGLLRSGLSIVLLTIANWIANRLTGKGIY